MDTDLGELDFPAPRHDARCSTWLSSWPQDTCNCGADERPLTTADRIALICPLPVELACDDIEEAS